jgi:hypothetical protein
MDEWVVTYRFHSSDCCSVMEFFRGTESECRYIGQQFAGGSCDLDVTQSWDVLIGPAKDWDKLLQDDDETEDEQ